MTARSNPHPDSPLRRISLAWGDAPPRSFEVRASAIRADLSAPPVAPVADLRAAAARALSNPIDFPPLSRAVVPGDKVTLAVAEGVPQLSTLVAAAMDVLLAGGVEPADVTILRPGSERERASFEPDPAELLSDDVKGQVKFAWHDPHDRNQLGYVASTESAHRIYLNAAVVDADFVLPIGCAHWDPFFGASVGYSTIFPRFANHAERHRYRVAAAGAEDRRLGSERADVDEAGWLAGIHFCLAVAPATGSQLAAVWAGDPKAVARAATEWVDAYLRPKLPSPAALVVCALTGNAGQQSWDAVGRALSTAARLMEPGGSVAILTDLGAALGDDVIGPALLKVAAGDPSLDLLDELQKQGAEDVFPALGLLAALRKGRVFLRSNLPADKVEELGMGAIESDEDLQRLITRADSVIFLNSAQFLSPRTE